MASRINKYVDGKFTHVVDLKDGFPVKNCQKRRLLGILVLIIHPEKPTRVTITLGNIIFGVLEDCLVD